MAWYRQRVWTERVPAGRFKDAHSVFVLDRTRVGTAARLGRHVAALSLALAWLDERRDFPPGALPARQAA